MKLTAWQCLIAFLSSVGLLTIVVGLTLLVRMESSTEPKLFAHPHALWVGAEDGGVFVEITKHEAPDYYVEFVTKMVGCGLKAGFDMAPGTAIHSALRQLVATAVKSSMSIRVSRSRRKNRELHSDE